MQFHCFCQLARQPEAQEIDDDCGRLRRGEERRIRFFAGLAYAGLDGAAGAGWYQSVAYQALIPIREQAADVVLLTYEA